MRIKDVIFDSRNLKHLIERHPDIDPEEIEQVLSQSNTFYRKTGQGRYLAWGRTFDGRYLLVVFEMLDKDVARPITARDLNAAEKARFKERR